MTTVKVKTPGWAWGAVVASLALYVLGMVVGACSASAHAQAVAPPTAALCPPAAWWTTYGPWVVGVVLAVLPTLITGLSNQPKAKGVVAVLQTFLAVLSVVTHKDAAGTFKAPLVPPPAKG